MTLQPTTNLNGSKSNVAFSYQDLELEEEKMNKYLGLFPPNNTYLPKVWGNYFSILRSMYYVGLLDKKDVKDYLEIFYQIPDSEKQEKLSLISEEVNKKISQYDLLQAANIMKNTIDRIIEIADQFPEPYKTDLLFRIATGEKLPEEIRKDLIDNDQIEPEQVEDLQRLMLQNVYLKQNFRLGSGIQRENNSSSDFNKPISSEKLKEFLNQNDPVGAEMEMESGSNTANSSNNLVQDVQVQPLQANQSGQNSTVVANNVVPFKRTVIAPPARRPILAIPSSNPSSNSLPNTNLPPKRNRGLEDLINKN